MDKRISELRDRLWKKKAALQQKENLPVSAVMPEQHKIFTKPDRNPLTVSYWAFYQAAIILYLPVSEPNGFDQSST